MKTQHTIGRVLYIEDNPLNIRLVKKSLVHMGYEVLQAFDAISGLETAAREQPDMILMDINLPGMNGIEATEMLKKQAETAHIPVVALTADVTQKTRNLCMNGGFNGYIEKPVSRSLLLKTVARTLDERVTF